MSKRRHKKTDYDFSDIKPPKDQDGKPNNPFYGDDANEPPKSLGKRQEVKLNFSDYWNIFVAIFRNEALAQLKGQSLYDRALFLRRSLAIGFIMVVIVAIIILFVK